ncbi:MAG: hypothetical protein KAJ47_01435 [Candidatus Aenigmarchaeota archaeon]|nr:hypothetical protein [Candidatus Aenigmarchaeota archaeon]
MSKKKILQRNSKFWEMYGSSKLKLSLCFNKGLILDTKLLILYLVGIYDIRNKTHYLDRFSLCNKDYVFLTRFFEQMRVIDKLIITPQILSEFCSLINTRLKTNSSNFMFNILSLLKDINEEYITKNEILEEDEFCKYGSTDIGIYIMSNNKDYPVITCDSDLTGLIEKNNNLVINFEEIKCLI